MKWMAPPTVVEEAEFEVTRVEAEGGSSGAAAAFTRLEARMPTLRGAKMYGVFWGDPERYFACLRLDAKGADDLGFERAVVPGGPYGRRMVRDWSVRIAELPGIFDGLLEDLVAAGFLIDTTRPSIEYYRRRDELIVMAPVLPRRVRG
jgi:hypothetical protein